MPDGRQALRERATTRSAPPRPTGPERRGGDFVHGLLGQRLAEPVSGRIQLLAGPRQVGKTTLLLEIAEEAGKQAVRAAADAPEAALPGFQVLDTGCATPAPNLGKKRITACSAMKAAVNALIFDCDGTLADTMPAHYHAWMEVLRPFGVSFPEDRFYAMGGMPTGTIVEKLFGEKGKTADVELLTRLKEEAFIRRMGEIRPVEKVVEVARKARGRLPMAVASGGHRHMVEKTLRQIGILDWFPVIVAAEDTARHKPEPDVFLEAARRLGASPGDCTVYEDTDLGIEAARRAGMRWVDVRAL